MHTAVNSRAMPRLNVIVSATRLLSGPNQYRPAKVSAVAGTEP